jgi:antitoxin MazE
LSPKTLTPRLTPVDTLGSDGRHSFPSGPPPLGNSLGICLPAAIAREAQLQEDQAVELSVVDGGVMIRPVRRRFSLAQRLAAYEPMDGEPIEALAFRPLGAEVFEGVPAVGFRAGCPIAAA